MWDNPVKVTTFASVLKGARSTIRIYLRTMTVFLSAWFHYAISPISNVFVGRVLPDSAFGAFNYYAFGVHPHLIC